MHLKWSAVCAVQDQALRQRILSSLGPGNRILELERDHYELFTDRKEEPRLLTSAVRQYVHDWTLYAEFDEENARFNRDFWWSDILAQKFGVPVAAHMRGRAINTSVRSQLLGKPFRCGIAVNHEGVDCVLTGIIDLDKPNPSPNNRIVAIKDDTEVVIADARYFIIDS